MSSVFLVLFLEEEGNETVLFIILQHLNELRDAVCLVSAATTEYEVRVRVRVRVRVGVRVRVRVRVRGMRVRVSAQEVKVYTRKTSPTLT